MIKTEDNDLILSTGTRLYAHCGIIGIQLFNDNAEEIYDGFDDDINLPYEGRNTRYADLTPEECVELADEMIKTWARFREKYEKLSQI